MITDLRALHTFLQGQRALLDPTALASVQEQQCKVWTSRLKTAGLSPALCATITELLATGPWLPDQKQQLGQALAASMAGCKSGGRRPLQKVMGFGAYLTDGDLKSLAGDAHAIFKLDVLAQRCVQLGLHLPSEQTVRHIIATAVDCALLASRAVLDLYFDSFTL